MANRVAINSSRGTHSQGSHNSQRTRNNPATPHNNRRIPNSPATPHNRGMRRNPAQANPSQAMRHSQGIQEANQGMRRRRDIPGHNSSSPATPRNRAMARRAMASRHTVSQGLRMGSHRAAIIATSCLGSLVASSSLRCCWRLYSSRCVGMALDPPRTPRPPRQLFRRPQPRQPQPQPPARPSCIRTV